MLTHERYPVTKKDEIRSLSTVFGHDSILNWFRNLPEEAKLTAGSAEVPDSDLQVTLIQDRWNHRLSAAFTSNTDPAAATLTVRARQLHVSPRCYPDELLLTQDLTWQRHGPHRLDMLALGGFGGRSGSSINPYIFRVENNFRLERFAAEERILAIGHILREQMASEVTESI